MEQTIHDIKNIRFGTTTKLKSGCYHRQILITTENKEKILFNVFSNKPRYISPKRDDKKYLY